MPDSVASIQEKPMAELQAMREAFEGTESSYPPPPGKPLVSVTSAVLASGGRALGAECIGGERIGEGSAFGGECNGRWLRLLRVRALQR